MAAEDPCRSSCPGSCVPHFYRRMMSEPRGRPHPDIPDKMRILKDLIAAYQADTRSRYTQLKFETRVNYDKRLQRIRRDVGRQRIADMNARMLLRWHDDWASGGKISMGHALVSMLRTLFSFGAKTLNDEDCGRVRSILSFLRFETAPRRLV
jgi:hypothetical protein